MSRVLGVELRRSAALGTALILLVIGTLALYFAEGIGFATGWMQLAMSQRLYLALLWPIALAAGAWQSSREHRSKVTELFASTPRPRAHRTLPTLGAMAVAVVGGYLAMGIAGGLWIIATARYFPLTVLVVTAVGALSLIAAVWLGQAIGRLLPWLVVAPALGVAGLALLLLIPGATRPHGWLALVFSPIYEMNMPGAYATVPGRASLSQAIWMLALAATAVLLLASDGWRPRVAALLPVALGVTLAIAVMPRDNRYVTDAIDPVAQEQVCAGGAPRVCVSRVHSGMLADVTGPAREALTVLAKLPGAPTAMHEDTTSYPDFYPVWHDDVVLLRVETGEKLTASQVVAAAFDTPPQCDRPTPRADGLAAAYWLLGQEPAVSDPDDPALAGEVAARWQALHTEPAAEAQAHLLALRKAALTCTIESDILSRDIK
ncbi:hypothetical protein [Paractinoplanes durhamensis]|uniref:ABC transporter permease n=1 Tax=Paractinoplanes durhamensis TaxID=113563 RepID=A0ABQ3YUZ7_9ACTN|nr:hypothetical protein [Actinoplanes durhamensis]GIE01423.1 hypothetical protein Adu01nite_27730 [Actinoplanes durhamensis]